MVCGRRTRCFQKEETRIKNIYGQLSGLKTHHLQQLDRIYRRRIPADQVITQELANYVCAVSQEIGRQVGLLIDRRGAVEYVMVGSPTRIDIPDLGRFRAGVNRLRGLRCLHTHLTDLPLTRDDLTDLALLRFDLMGAIVVNADGLPAKYYLAHLVPDNPEDRRWDILPPAFPGQMALNFGEFIQALEDEFRRTQGPIDVDGVSDRAILVGVTNAGNRRAEESLHELRELAQAAGVAVVDAVLQKRDKPDPKFLIGKGKLDELILRSLQLGAELVIFDHDLTPAQAKIIADATDLKILDRTQLILDIFAQRAKSRVGKVQVELAQLKYQLPRLGRRDDGLSRLTGGIGGRGPGETRLEIDRRRARDRIRDLEKQVDHLRRSRQQLRSKRQRKQVPIISIVGYTNAGKSTLLNTLTQSDVEVKDQLFATLDPTSRRLRFPRDIEVVITDTVGFLRDLPKDLVEAFRATLEELEDADLLLHVVDASNPEFEDQIVAVNQILADLRLDQIPQLVVFNKEDLVEPDVVRSACARYQGVSIAALHRPSLRKLIARVEDEILRQYPEQGRYRQLKPAMSPPLASTIAANSATLST
jgi:GTPase